MRASSKIVIVKSVLSDRDRSRSQSPSRFRPSTVNMIASPGKTLTHHADLEIGAPVGEHAAPARDERIDAEPEEGEAAFEQDVVGDLQRHQDDDGAENVGQDMR